MIIVQCIYIEIIRDAYIQTYTYKYVCIYVYNNQNQVYITLLYNTVQYSTLQYNTLTSDIRQQLNRQLPRIQHFLQHISSILTFMNLHGPLDHNSGT
mgnify:CR=1 FL=1